MRIIASGTNQPAISPKPTPRPPKTGSAFDYQEVSRIESDTTIREIIVIGLNRVRHILLMNDYERPIKVEAIGKDKYKITITVR